MAHPTRCLGLILVHPTSTAAGPMKHFRAVVHDTWRAKETAINGAIERWLYDDKEEYELQKIWERDNERYELRKSWERYNERCKERFKEDKEAAIKYYEIAEINQKCDYVMS